MEVEHDGKSFMKVNESLGRKLSYSRLKEIIKIIIQIKKYLN